jgi:hypothetical protein
MMARPFFYTAFLSFAMAGISALAEPESETDSESDEAFKPSIYDHFGRRLTNLSLSFGSNYTHERVIETERRFLRYRGPKGVFLHGEVSNCTIGMFRVPDSHVKVKLNGKDFLAVKTRLKNFHLHVELANPQTKSGAIQCGYVRLLVD